MKTWEGHPVLEPGLFDIASSRTTIIIILSYSSLLRMDVINELLNIVRDNVELQRLYGEVKQQLVWLESRQ